MKKYWCILLFAICTCMLSCGSEKQNGGETKEEEQEEVNGEQAEQEEVEQKQAKQEKTDSESLSGELTILSVTSVDYWRPVIEAFEKEYPDVTVHVDMPSEEEELTEEYYERVITKIISGENIDLVPVEILSMEKYGEQQGLLVDLNEMIAADETFYREDYFTCIFEPLEIEGKLYGLPRTVAPLYCRLNKELLDAAGVTYEKDTISFWDLYTLYQEVQDHAENPIYFADSSWYDPVGGYEVGYYIRNQLIDSAEYIEYLEMNAQLEYPSSPRTYISETGKPIDEDSFMRMVQVYPLAYSSVVNELFEDTKEAMHVIPYEGMHGERYFAGNSLLGISSMCENKELAWEFLKFSIGDYDFDGYGLGLIPVNKNKAERLAQGLTEEVRERLFADIETLDTMPFSDVRLGLLLDSIQQDFFLHQTITAEECAKKMAERVEIYMKE